MIRNPFGKQAGKGAAGACLCLAAQLCAAPAAWADIARPQAMPPSDGQRAEIALQDRWYSEAGEPCPPPSPSMIWRLPPAKPGDRRAWLRRSAPVLRIHAKGPARWSAFFSGSAGMENASGTIGAGGEDVRSMPLKPLFSEDGAKIGMTVEIVPLDCGAVPQDMDGRAQCADVPEGRTVQRFILTVSGEGGGSRLSVNGRPLGAGPSDCRVSAVRGENGRARLKEEPWTGPLPPGVADRKE